MKSHLAMVVAACLVVPSLLVAQHSPVGNRSGRQVRSAAAASPTPAPAPGEPRLHQRSWVDVALEQFNPDDLDYGAWMEQRRQAFLDAKLRNPYFHYSLWSTVGLLLMFVVCAKLWIDNRRFLWITAEQMADLYNQDALSRKAAHEAIKRYNDHIEACNRAIEMEQSGRSNGFQIAPTAEGELRRLEEELGKTRAENSQLQVENTTKEKTLAALSLRIDGNGGSVPGGNATNNGPDLSQADAKLVSHINRLQEELYAERKKNKRLQGA
jgi:hypothetical protein